MRRATPTSTIGLSVHKPGFLKGTLRLSAWWCCTTIQLAVPGLARAQPPAYAEQVTVARVAIDVHVINADGSPVKGLDATHFRVRVDGKPAAVISARWTTEAVADREPLRPDAAAATGVPAGAPLSDRVDLPRGRQVVLLIQKDLEPTRIEGLIGLLRRARAFVAALPPDDRVAVLSFDSRLTLWSDFTRDRAVLDGLFERRLLLSAPPADVTEADVLSLARYVERRAADRAASMEQALLVLARALSRVPGAKALVVLGHGFGRLGPAGADGLPMSVSLDREYGPAGRLFMSGRTTVYCLDTTRAAAHSMEAGLRQVAADTGGFFLRTHEFPDAALRRLGDALAGRYELSIEKPPLPPGEHRITVELIGRKGLVLARRSYVG